jgi:hypothetical protein
VFLNNLIFCKEKKALAFNRDRCCHLALCLQLILFDWRKSDEEKSFQCQFYAQLMDQISQVLQQLNFAILSKYKTRLEMSAIDKYLDFSSIA